MQRVSLSSFIILYGLMYASFGATSPYWPRLFEHRGLTPEQIGILLGLGTAARLVAGPLTGRIADMLGSLRATLAACAGFAALLSPALLVVDGFLALTVVHIAHAAMLAPITTLADALAINAARAPRNGFEYGWVRGSASAAFIVGTLAAGQIISAIDLAAIAWTPTVLLGGVVLSVGLLPRLDALSVQSTCDTFSILGGVRTLCRIALFRRVLLVAALVYGSHAMYDAFAVIRWNAAGVSPTATSLLWSEAVAAEVLVFFWIGPVLIIRMGTGGAAALAAAAGIVRWMVMSQTAAPTALALVQPLHGFTFALLHLACMRVVALIVPIHLAATAQALYASGAGAATALLTLLSGQLYGQLGAHAFSAMALLCALAVPLALGLHATGQKIKNVR
jgi:MFS transporter, PPP family, 3-phenylpropionic acid transporter